MATVLFFIPDRMQLILNRTESLRVRFLRSGPKTGDRGAQDYEYLWLAKNMGLEKERKSNSG